MASLQHHLLDNISKCFLFKEFYRSKIIIFIKEDRVLCSLCYFLHVFLQKNVLKVADLFVVFVSITAKDI
ncbi:hypothetical protein D0T56_07815 [Dysgonomonas sp. 520]|nr:hypothetical protein [Dysgonomonas sp. 520]